MNLLDRHGDEIVPDGYVLVETEVAFLRHALDRQPLFVRGADLCDWAETFYRGRKVAYQEFMSLTRELTLVCPELTGEDARTIYATLKHRYDDLPRPLTPRQLLKMLHPQRLWDDYPSKQHGATWLLWVASAKNLPAEQALLKAVAEEWEREAPADVSELYRYSTAKEAEKALLQWLGVYESPETLQLGDFPEEVPSSLIQKARSIWNREIIETNGQSLVDILRRCSTRSMKLIAVDVATSFFKQNPKHLTGDLCNAMSSYLTERQQQELSQFVPPAIPDALPAEPQGVLEWYRNQYLRYRLWQSKYGAEQERKIVLSLSQSFIDWYLAEYPRALMGSSLARHLSFNRSAALASERGEYVSFVVLLDGLHVSDAGHILRHLQNRAERLSIVEEAMAFTALPTVTEFCKDALLKGAPPVNALDHSSLGDGIIPEKGSPSEILKGAQRGQLYLWRVQEPDATYHSRNTFATLERDIESRLDAVAKKIIDVVNEVPTEIPLRIVVTTDHGRLLAKSNRTMPVPNGMTTHGRAAWGSTTKMYPSAGYLVERNVVYLDADKFALPNDAAVVLNEDAFHTNDDRTGSEWYPHGGLYPEEVIVPWLVYVRDLELPTVKVRLSGHGTAGTNGDISVSVDNLGDTVIYLAKIVLRSRAGVYWQSPLDRVCAPKYKSDHSTNLDPWPTQKDAKESSGTVSFRLLDGRTFEVEATVQIKSDEMYTQENILEGLDL